VGGSGSAWIKPKKQPGLRAATITAAPHPLSVRSGQRYFALDSRARNRATLRIVRVGSDHCEARREDAGARIVRVERARLLAVDDAGAGVHYRFVGYASRSGYRTHACVIALDGEWARLVCPEWHPGMPITVAAAALPPAQREPGSWVACKGDLGATAPARTGLRDLMPPAPRFDPSTLHPVAVSADDTLGRPSAAEDVVLFISGRDVRAAMTGDQGVYLTGHAPPTGPGRRAYLCVDGVVTGWRTVAHTRLLPNGTRVVLQGPWNAVAVDVMPALPATGVAGGRFGLQLWAKRSWPIEAERHPRGRATPRPQRSS
jgi:hypothetical protein